MIRFLIVASLLLAVFRPAAQTKLVLRADKPVAPVSPVMWGIFFEDINFAADGGLYAEKIKNRSFEFPMPMMGWKEVKGGGSGRILIENAEGSRKAHFFVNATSGSYGIANEGFRGIGYNRDSSYRFSMSARLLSGNVNARIEAVNSAGKKIGEATLGAISGDWKTYEAKLITTDSSMRGRFQLVFEGTGELLADHISLFPQHTWKDRPNGMRADLVQWLAEMKPGFLRFPGGCIVEGRDLANRYQWKQTVGNVAERKTMINRWNVEFRHKQTPDYFQSFGLGFYEYFLLSEDIGASPLPILNCGMACQYNSAEVAALTEIDPYVQDALDLIEFANGATSTKWGGLREVMGHPAPFNLKYLGIGNEQWDEQYIERYTIFHRILKEKHPEIELVSSVGPSPDGRLFDYAWKELRSIKADIVDEHYYANPDWFLKQASRYDGYDRKGPKIFAGEYAAQSKGIAQVENINNWRCALAEAAFMTGLERNGDIVRMASYAPLFAHADAWQWAPDLIWFDNLRSYGTPNYYVQQLFSLNKGTEIVQLLQGDSAVKGQESVFASAVKDAGKREIILKMVNAGSKVTSFDIDTKSFSPKSTLHITTLAGELAASNTLDAPKQVVPFSSTLKVKGKTTRIFLPPASLSIVKWNY